MSFYEGPMTKVGLGSGLLEEFPLKVGAHKGSVFFPMLCETVMVKA